ncbi:Ig-like domain-containing protein [Lysinibacter cavernae]|uniref:Fibronectin type-III domain-containing protein n=1 Tax=Lysinibacter cavernae TaxID=1640652 RepID=A0A7X5R0T9_9MICO|nr:Ig-like domain-containing protein [Lysinibacter cavernae]NIH53609.1 hypothetical protein [Lysinibacter cavernae]
MLLRWFRKNIAAAMSGVAVVVVLALVVTIAVTTGGYTTQRMDLNDASTWVVNGNERAIGRLNTQIAALDTAKRSDRPELTSVQNDSLVLLHSVGQKELGVVDEALSEIAENIQLPADATEVLLSDKTVVVHSSTSGKVWFVSTKALDSFNAEAEPDLVLGDNSAAAVSADGQFVGYSAAGGLIETNINRVAAKQSARKLNLGADDDAYQAAVVGGHSVVFNASEGQLSLDGQDARDTDTTDGARLMASAATATAVYLSDSAGVVRVPFSGGAERVFDDKNSSLTAASPVWANGCAFAAWTDGIAWKSCGSEENTLELQDLDSDAELKFATRSGSVVLNDERSGRAWMVQRDGELVNNWADILDNIEDEDKEEENDPNLPPEVDPIQKPPVAVDDVLGARPGKSSPLPVLLNDYDPNGDVIMITGTSGFPEEMGTVAPILNGQQLQVSLRPEASGSFDFQYTITDGRGGQATANVTVEVRTPEENSAPVQARRTVNTIVPGGQFNRDISTDWFDPDGDPFFLAEANVQEPDTATYSASGVVYYQDSSEGGANKAVSLAVSDGTLVGNGSLDIEVVGGAVPIIADAVAVLGNVNQELVATPLDFVRGGNGNVRLIGVPDDGLSNAKVKLDTDSGTVRFTASEPGSYLLDYKVTDGVSSGSGKLRFEVQPMPEGESIPVTVPASAFLYLGQTETINVLASDYDPAGGVLLISNVENTAADDGLLVEVLSHGILRVTLSEPLTERQAKFTYTVTNGSRTSEGTVTILQVDPPAKEKPPVALPDRAKVRVGEVIDIPVLENDLHPDRLPIILSGELARELPEGEGLLFATGNKLRYLAPDTPGEYTASYIVESPGGETATAPVQISVREVDAETNTAPTPKTVTARVVQGNTVKIPISLIGIDEDGDSVTLGGLETAPTKGTVVGTGKDYFEYEAATNQWGTDVFYYTVSDSLGATGVGQIRVGIMEPTGTARNPIARTDVLSVRPGTTFVVKPLENDSDPDGGRLDVVSVEQSDEMPSEFDGETVTLSVPKAEGVYSVLYTIENESGGQSSAWIQVSARKDAPPSRPIVDDTVLTLTDIDDDAATVSVDVWSKVFYAEGPNSDLELSTVTGWDKNVEVTTKRELSIAVTDKNQIVPFRVAVADSPEVETYGFVWVPGNRSAPPERRADAKSLTVESGKKLTIDVNDQVIAAGNKKVRITDASTVKATNSNGQSSFKNETTLEFVSQEKYWGPASIVFEVTDGSAGDAKGRTATIVLPITVTPTDNQPPTMRGSAVTLEPTGSRTIDLKDLTQYPYPDDMKKLQWSLPKGAPAGMTATLAGSSLTVSVPKDAQMGSVLSVQVGVRDDASEVAVASVDVTVVSSTKPKIQAMPDQIELTRGSSKSVDVLANDVVTSELMPMTVIGVESQNSVAGVTATPSGDNRTVTVTATANATITTNLQLTYRVGDATGQKDRIVTGTITVVIVDVPDAPGQPRYLRQDSFANDGALRISFAPSASANGKPIDNYKLRSTDGSVSVSCGKDTSSCTVTSGQAPVGKSLSYVAIATNSIGDSVESAASAPLRIDFVPEAPASVTVTQVKANTSQSNPGVLEVTWDLSTTPNGGSPVSEYEVTISGGAIPPTVVSASSRSYTTSSLPQGTYTATVLARNAIDETTYGAISWRSRTSAAVAAAHAPSVSLSELRTEGSNVVANWSGNAAGGKGPYFAAAWDPAALPGCTAVGTSETTHSSTNVQLTGSGTENRTVNVIVSNGWGCATASGSIAVHQKPATPGAPAVEANPGADLDYFGVKATAPDGGNVVYSFSVNGEPWFTSASSFEVGASSYVNAPTNVRVRYCNTSDPNQCSDPSPAGSAQGRDIRMIWPVGASCKVGGSSPTVPTPNGLNVANVNYWALDVNGNQIGDPWTGTNPQLPEGTNKIVAQYRDATMTSTESATQFTCAPADPVVPPPGNGN